LPRLPRWGIAIAQLDSPPVVFRSGAGPCTTQVDDRRQQLPAIYRSNTAIQLASHSLTIAIAKLRT
jgi:hypothetical protein